MMQVADTDADGLRTRAGTPRADSRKLILNTAILFLRMLCTFGVGLFVTRQVLAVLGPSDYGLMAALLSGGLLIGLASQALTSSSERHLAYDLGLASEGELRETFNSALALFGALGIGVLLLGWSIAPWVIESLTVPAGREAAAIAAFRATIVALAVHVVVGSFAAVVEARQAMGQVALLEVARSLLHLTVAISVGLLEGDRLILYAGLLAGVSMLRALLSAAICMYRFAESRPDLSAIRLRGIRRIIGFASWASLIHIADGAIIHGSIVLIAACFAPVVAAAYAIAMRVAEYHDNFSQVVPRVAQPAMATYQGRREGNRVGHMALASGRYSLLGISLFVAPMWLETETILALWLEDVPPLTSLLVRIEMAWLTLDLASRGLEIAAIAQGKIARYAVLSFVLWLSALPIAALAFRFGGAGAWALPATLCGVSLAVTALRLTTVRPLFGVTATDWVRETLAPVALVTLPSALLAWILQSVLPIGLLRVVAVFSIFAVSAAALSWRFALESGARRAILDLAREISMPWRPQAASQP